MLMFRFWSSDSGSTTNSSCHASQTPMFALDKPVPAQNLFTPDLTLPVSPNPSPPRRASNVAITPPPAAAEPSALKRQRPDGDDVTEDERPAKKAMATPPADAEATSSADTVPVTESSPVTADMERATEVIEAQMSLEILLKHDELRLINQELAKCQVALEQLRRCHLIPYPVNVPTPEQMLRIAGGIGPALAPEQGNKLPQWAPPFGVTDGPYARHYAKWLIPDPKFDGIPAPTLMHSDPARSSVSQEGGRSTRNSFTELSNPKGRPIRGNAGQKLQALSSGYAPPKSQQGPCTLKRSDGKTVKLVCIDCQRENFNSTQGFINHCRIAHKRDFKSHEEAAVHCGHPIDVPETVTPVAAPAEEKRSVAAPPPVLPSGLVHPFSRADGMADSQACFSVVNRIQQSMNAFRKGTFKLDGVQMIPGVAKSKRSAPQPKSTFASSAQSPYLSRLLQSRGFKGHLDSMVADAKVKTDLNELAYEDDDEDDDDVPMTDATVRKPVETPVPVPKMRVPTSSSASATRPASSKSAKHSAKHHAMSLATPTPLSRSSVDDGSQMALDDDLMAPELSPNTAISNNAPSLVSDDSDYDDSEADSESVSDELDTRSISDVEEIDIESHHQGPEAVGGGAGVCLRKDEAKHVSFITPVKNDAKREQKRS